jgi:hypothetical protein
MAEPESRNTSEVTISYPNYGLPAEASIAITSVVTGQFTIVESAGYRTIGRLGGAATTIVIGSVDIVDAYRNGNTNDVVVHSFGLGGAVFGGLIAGAAAGGAAGLWLGPIGGGVIGFLGGVAGAFYGEDWVESKVNSWLTQRTTGPYEDPRSMSEIEGWGVEPPRGFPASTPIATSLAGTHSFGDSDSSNDNDWRRPMQVSGDAGPIGANFRGVVNGSGGGANSTVGPGSGGSGSEENHSLPSSTGYSSKGVYDVEGPEGHGVSKPSAPKSVNNTKSSNTNKNDGLYHSLDHYERVGQGKVKTGLPIILDLDGDGIEVNMGFSASFDFDGDGFREWTTWAAPSDAFLVIDLNADGTRGTGDGKIDQQKELVFGAWGPDGATDLQALAEHRDANGQRSFDTNGDGVLDASDSSFGEFRIWQDANQNGEVDEGELRTLASAGISQINLTYDNGLGYGDESDDISAGLAKLKGTASFVMNGELRTGGVGDLELAYIEKGWRRVETETGFRIEFETGKYLEHRQLAANEVNFSLGDDATGVVSAAGNSGANVLDASAKTVAVTLDGGAGDDRLLGGSGNDVLVGLLGNNEVHGC